MTARYASASLSRLLELLELEQPRVVTRDDLERLAKEAGVTWPPRLVWQRLRERGWLMDLKTRGVWEFVPAARAGTYSSGDPLIELRAVLARRPEAPFSVAAESAAYLLGLATRRPIREIIGAPPGATIPPALRDYRGVRWSPRSATVERDALPVWSVAALLAFMAVRPNGYRDWPNVGDWIADAAAQVTVGDLRIELEGRPRSAWARTAYLLHRGRATQTAREVFAIAPSGHGPYYLGPRRDGGRCEPSFEVIHSTHIEATREPA